MRKYLLYFVFVICLATIVSSCGKDKVYQSRETFSDNTWDRLTKDNTVTFSDIEIEDTTSVYDIYVTLRHAPFINENKVKVLMKVIYPSGISRESVHTIKLRDRFDKKWVGDAMGDLIDVEDQVKHFVSLPEKGTYTISLTNLGKYSKLVGIMDIGVMVKKSNLKDYKNAK